MEQQVNKPSSPSTPMSPIKGSERIQILDILRGFAIFGILAVNIAGFASPAFLPGYVFPQDIPWYDSLAESLVQFLAESKFYTIFSFLFGLGFSVQLARVEARGGDMRSFYPRRLWVLFFIGLLHTLFLWMGDILRLYALLGFALLTFRNSSKRTLTIWIGVLYVLTFFLLIMLEGSGDTTIPRMDIIAMAREAYTSSSYLPVLIFQVFSGIASFIIITLTQGTSALALFLLGLLAGRSKLFERLSENQFLLKRIFWIALPIGLLGNAAYVLLDNVWLATLGVIFGSPALSAVYVSGIALLSLRESGKKILSPLGSVGRMALTNYVLQSLVCLILFSGFGTGLYEKVGGAGLLGITLLIYLAQIPLSGWWLRRFKFGPLEWIWRSLTYRKRQPMRIA